MVPVYLQRCPTVLITLALHNHYRLSPCVCLQILCYDARPIGLRTETFVGGFTYSHGNVNVEPHTGDLLHGVNMLIVVTDDPPQPGPYN